MKLKLELAWAVKHAGCRGCPDKRRRPSAHAAGELIGADDQSKNEYPRRHAPATHKAGFGEILIRPHSHMLLKMPIR